MELENVVVKRPLRQTLAQFVSAIVHPVAFPLLTLAAITYTQTGSARTAAILCLVALALTTAPIAALVGYQVARGRWTDLDVSVRQQRYTLYPIGIVFELLLVGALFLMRAPHGAIVAGIAMTTANIVDGVINFADKISVHTTAAATCAALLWLFVPGWGAPAALAAALVGWSRVELGRHTTGQVMLGWLVGAASALLAQALFV